MYRHCINGKFESFIIHFTDIRSNHRRIVGSRNHRNRIQQVLGVALVIVHRTIDTVIKEAVIQSDVISFGSLPFNVGVITIRTIRIIPFISELIASFRIGYCESCHIRIVVQNILLSGLSVAQTQLQVRQNIRISQESFLADFPSQCHGREQSPTIAFCKTG